MKVGLRFWLSLEQYWGFERLRDWRELEGSFGGWGRDGIKVIRDRKEVKGSKRRRGKKTKARIQGEGLISKKKDKRGVVSSG